MDFYDFKNAFLIGVFMAFMIGPVFFILIQTSILKGFRAAIAFDIGVILGDISLILIAYYTSRTLLERVKDNPIFFSIGGLIFFVYGLLSLLKKKKIQKDKKNNEVLVDNNYIKLLFKGFFINFINIGVLAGWLAIIIFVSSSLNMNTTNIFWYFTTIIIGYIVTDLIKIILAKQLKNKMTPIVIYNLEKIISIILIIWGLFLILKAFISEKSIYKLILQLKEHIILFISNYI